MKSQQRKEHSPALCNLRFYTGDELGQVKCVKFCDTTSKKSDTDARNHKRARLEEDSASDAKQKKTVEEDAQHCKVLSWGRIDREREVTMMTLSKSAAHPTIIVVGRKSGEVDIVSGTDGAVLANFRVFTPAKDKNGRPAMNRMNEPEHFVGLHHSTSTNELITCTDTGFLRVHDCATTTEKVCVNVGQDQLSRMRVKPQAAPDAGIVFATGGKDRELCVWDLDAVLKTESGKKAEPRWKAKNVRNDVLDLRVPVWNTDMAWMEGDGEKIVVCTGIHFVRVYDLKAGKRPTLNIEIGEHPLKCIALVPGTQEVVVTDTTGLIIQVDVGNTSKIGIPSTHPKGTNRSMIDHADNPSATTKPRAVGTDTSLYAVAGPHGAVRATFRGSAGAVRCVAVARAPHTSSVIVTGVGLDRFVRCFEVGKKKEAGRCYVKTRMNWVVVAEEEEGVMKEEEKRRKEREEGRDEEDEDGEDGVDLWAELDRKEWGGDEEDGDSSESEDDGGEEDKKVVEEGGVSDDESEKEEIEKPLPKKGGSQSMKKVDSKKSLKSASSTSAKNAAKKRKARK
ncbi:WD40-repeat-containing domain protein [Cladochytrium replicatum]|nr:WD40-repeat-containing domain protein [Cladochytrium replicatum]